MQETQNKTAKIAKATKKVKATTQTTSKKNKVIAFRFALTPEIEIVITSLENCFIGLDRSEIVKLALNQLYKNNKLDESNILNNITNTLSISFDKEEDFFAFWNKNKTELR